MTNAPGQAAKRTRTPSVVDASLQAVGLGATAASLPADGLLGKTTGGVRSGDPALGPGTVPVTLEVNGETIRMRLEPRVTLLDAIRNHIQIDTQEAVDLTGAKRVCDRSSCGACTVVMDGRTVNACSVLAIEAQGREIATVESLDKNGQLHPVQQAFIDCDGLQCGFCTPGFIVSSAALLHDNPHPTKDEIERALSGNICRCGTQDNVLKAVQKAARISGREGLNMPSWPEKRNLIGSSFTRIDGPLKVSGKAKYSYDRNLPGLVHGKILRSPHAHARIKSLDLSAAEGLRGVVATHSIKQSGAELHYIGDEIVALSQPRPKSSLADATAGDSSMDYEVLPHVVVGDSRRCETRRRLREGASGLRRVPATSTERSVESAVTHRGFLWSPGPVSPTSASRRTDLVAQWIER